MQRIFNFVIKNSTFLLFLLLFCIALTLIIQSHSYHRSKFINSANEITGGIYSISNSINQYFNLKEKNEILSEENRLLRRHLYNINTSIDSSSTDTTYNKDIYTITTAKVYKNSYALPNNYITINKGRNDSIKRDYGVVTTNGILGIVDNISNNYATVLSVLSKKSKINAQLKTTNHIGSLEWNGKSPDVMLLTDVPKFAPVKIGDTIITGGESAIFPKGIDIGIIDSFETDVNGDTYKIRVKLFNDMTNISTVYIIHNLDKPEIQALENSVNE